MAEPQPQPEALGGDLLLVELEWGPRGSNPAKANYEGAWRSDLAMDLSHAMTSGYLAAVRTASNCDKSRLIAVKQAIRMGDHD